jgi:hypothetical protein
MSFIAGDPPGDVATLLAAKSEPGKDAGSVRIDLKYERD